MKKIVNGRKYDTDTAKTVGQHEENSIGDFTYVCETLYRKRTGEYFLHGYGHAASKYAKIAGDNSWSGGSEIIPLSYDRAREWAEKYLDADDYETEFGEVSEDGNGDVMLSVRVSPQVKSMFDRLAATTGRSKSDLLSEAILKLQL